MVKSPLWTLWTTILVFNRTWTLVLQVSSWKVKSEPPLNIAIGWAPLPNHIFPLLMGVLQTLIYWIVTILINYIFRGPQDKFHESPCPQMRFAFSGKPFTSNHSLGQVPHVNLSLPHTISNIISQSWNNQPHSHLKNCPIWTQYYYTNFHLWRQSPKANQSPELAVHL